jgi:hypothetical protein
MLPKNLESSLNDLKVWLVQEKNKKSLVSLREDAETAYISFRGSADREIHNDP